MSPRIVLVHAVEVAMAPVHAAFASAWPEAELVNLLDDSLSGDRAAAGELTPSMCRRFEQLTRYALELGADGILFTCSAFGDAIDAARAGVDIPVLKPNEAMFTEALAHGRSVGMLATFEPSVASMDAEFREAAAAAGVDAVLTTRCVPEARAALERGDAETHNALLARAVAALDDPDVLLLAHFSTSRAAEAVTAAADCPVLTSPGSAVARLKSALS